MSNPDNSKMTLTPWKKNSMTILLIGETGVGKTVFFDLLANACAGRLMEEFKDEHDRENECGGPDAGGRSQTMKPKLYRITCPNGSTINVIDTPGLSDPRGMEFDDEHKQAIADFIKAQIDAIDCVLILANGTVAHVSIPTRYTLSIISSMFPSSIVDNVAFLFTMVPSPLHFNFKRETLPDAVRNAKFWGIDNPLAMWQRFQKALKSGDLPEDFEEAARDELKGTYDKGLETLNSFFAWVDERKVQPTKEINDLHRMSERMEAALSNVLTHFAQAEVQRTELIKLQRKIDSQNQIRQVYENYESVITRHFYVQEGTDAHNTLCCASNCYQNCHLLCPLEFTLDHDALGRNCDAFSKQIGPDGGYICNECGHSSKLHRHYRSKWVQKQESQTYIDHKAQDAYHQAQSEGEHAQFLAEVLEKRIKDSDARVAADMEELGAICEEYGRLSLSGDFVGHFSQGIMLLTAHEHKMTEEGAAPEALERIAGHIKALKQKRAILEEVEKKVRTK